MKKIAKLIFKNLGYELKRISTDHIYHIDVYLDQKKLLPFEDAPIIFDVGANIGQTAIKYKEVFKSPQIFCFEPFEECFNTLVKKTEAIKGIN